MFIKPAELAQTIDYTLLKPEATRAHITELCARAKEFNFMAVCINPYHVRQAARELAESAIKTCTVVGFPLGANTSKIKAAEAVEAVKQGASEIDFVINIGELKSGNERAVKNDVCAIVDSVKDIAPDTVVKAILETCLLTDDEKIKACEICVSAGVDYVKTSTGFSSGGATVEDVALLKNITGPQTGVKASGGIKDFNTAIKMLKVGATRLGTSSGVQIMREALKSDH